MVYSAYTRAIFHQELWDGWKALQAFNATQVKACFSRTCRNVSQLIFKRKIDYLDAKEKNGVCGGHPLSGEKTSLKVTGTGVLRRVHVCKSSSTADAEIKQSAAALEQKYAKVDQLATRLWLQENAFSLVAGVVIDGLLLYYAAPPLAVKGAVLCLRAAVGVDRQLNGLFTGV